MSASPYRPPNRDDEPGPTPARPPRKRRDRGPDGRRVRTAAEVATAIGSSEWWVKEQARKGRIPFVWISRSYRFTDEHVTEILRIFERRPATPAEQPAPGQGAPTRASRAPRAPRVRPGTGAVVRLTARPPRRARRATEPPDDT